MKFLWGNSLQTSWVNRILATNSKIMTGLDSTDILWMLSHVHLFLLQFFSFTYLSVLYVIRLSIPSCMRGDVVINKRLWVQVITKAFLMCVEQPFLIHWEPWSSFKTIRCMFHKIPSMGTYLFTKLPTTKSSKAPVYEDAIRQGYFSKIIF